MAAVMAAALSIASMARIVYDMATLADFFSVFAFPIALFIYRLARTLAERSRTAHESSLREKDKRNIDHATAAIRTCHSVVLGISRSSAISSPNILILTQSLAITIGAIKTQHGHLLTETGLRAAECTQFGRTDTRIRRRLPGDKRLLYSPRPQNPLKQHPAPRRRVARGAQKAGRRRRKPGLGGRRARAPRPPTT